MKQNSGKDIRNNQADSSLQRVVATPAAIFGHTRYCKICKLPPEIRSSVNRMIADDEPAGVICSTLDSMGYPGFTSDNLLTHKAFFKYVADEATIAEVLAKVNGDEGLKQRFLSEYEEQIVQVYEEVQRNKNKELAYIWGEVIPTIRQQIMKVKDNALLPVKDYASAYDIMLKDALLLEGKPTGRLYVEQHDNGTGGNYLKGIDKLCQIVGVEFESIVPGFTKPETEGDN